MIKMYLTEVNGSLCGMFNDFDDATHNLLGFGMEPSDLFFIHEVDVEPAELGEPNILVDTNLGYFVHVETPQDWEEEELEDEDIEGVYRIKKRGKSWEFRMDIVRNTHHESQLGFCIP